VPAPRLVYIVGSTPNDEEAEEEAEAIEEGSAQLAGEG
jgi:hypothetical protein